MCQKDIRTLLKQFKSVLIPVSTNRNLPDVKEQNSHPKKTKAGNKSKFYTSHKFPLRAGIDLCTISAAKALVELYHTTAQRP